jgi:hypothetical protein
MPLACDPPPPQGYRFPAIIVGAFMNKLRAAIALALFGVAVSASATTNYHCNRQLDSTCPDPFDRGPWWEYDAWGPSYPNPNEPQPPFTCGGDVPPVAILDAQGEFSHWQCP